MRLIFLVDSPSVQKHQDSKSQECEFPSSESVRSNINSHCDKKISLSTCIGDLSNFTVGALEFTFTSSPVISADT